MQEQSKAAWRRISDGAFHARYFVGSGIDVGSGDDGLARVARAFRGIKAVRHWDVADGDAQLLQGVPDASFDFLHSSHCLEHMEDPRAALANWIRVVRRGGYLVITVPDEDLYERGHWPSRFNFEHRWSFTVYKPSSWSPVSINLIDLVREFAARVELERLIVLRDFFDDADASDQTLGLPECAIEMVLRRR